jgi:hypothetical protein
MCQVKLYITLQAQAPKAKEQQQNKRIIFKKKHEKNVKSYIYFRSTIKY